MYCTCSKRGTISNRLLYPFATKMYCLLFRTYYEGYVDMAMCWRVYRCLRKKRPSHYIATNRDMHYSLQNTSRNAYRYISLYIAMVVFFADTGMSLPPWLALRPTVSARAQDRWLKIARPSRALTSSSGWTKTAQHQSSSYML